jgi:5-methylthioadenosine/S-adenosylhomocysteine deaminase
MTILLHNATVLTVDVADHKLEGVDIRIAGRDIVSILPTGPTPHPDETVIDCRRGLVLPGFVNVHTHAATHLYRGLADDLPAAFWPPAYRVPDQDRFGAADLALSLQAACAEYLLSGVTCIADRLGNMDRFAPIIAAAGLRAIVGQTLTDANADAAWRITDALVERYGVDGAELVSAGIAPHALDSCSDALLARCARRAETLGARVFLHVAQSRPEVAAVKARGHSGALACLQRAGLVGGHVVAAHAIYLDEAEIEAWCATGTAIAHCPASNLKIEARTLPLARFAGRVPVGLGTDWSASNNSCDMLAEVRLAALVGKLLAGDPQALDVRRMLRMLTIDGARVLGLAERIGSVEPGKRADLVVLDLDRLELTPPHDHASNVIYSANPRCVRDVIVDGRLRVRLGRLVDADEGALAGRHAELATRARQTERTQT